MLERHPNQSHHAGTWEELGAGAPALAGLAELCRRAIVQGPSGDLPELSPEALTLLYCGRQRGIYEVKAVDSAFGTPERLLAVYVEVSDDQTLMFRSRENPEITVRFFDAFRELCEAGLVLHHIYRDFSLSRHGFAVAATTAPQPQLAALAEILQTGI